MMSKPLVMLSIAVASAVGGICGLANADTPVAEIRTSDAQLFFNVLNTADGAPTVEALQHGYLDAGSDGVRQFIPYRIVSAKHLSETIAKHRDKYDNASNCFAQMPAVKARAEQSLAKLKALLPDGSFPPVVMLVGANNSGGTTGASGVLIGMEVACIPLPGETDVADHMAHLVAHEYVHVEQSWLNRDQPENEQMSEHPTVLRQSLTEGVAELVGEITSGGTLNEHLKLWTLGREGEIAKAFMAEKDSTTLSNWLFNGLGTPDKPGDLGYWVGYRIAKRYYEKAADPKQALRELVLLRDPNKILADSGWSPQTP
jgi:hypothetical protein